MLVGPVMMGAGIGMGKLAHPNGLTGGGLVSEGEQVSGKQQRTVNYLHISNWERKPQLPFGLSKRRRDRERDRLTELWPGTVTAGAGMQ